MKNIIMKFLAVIALTLGPVFVSLAQPLPDATSGNGTIGGGAPVMNCVLPTSIGDGYIILLALTLCYGIYKFWQMRQVEKTA